MRYDDQDKGTCRAGVPSGVIELCATSIYERSASIKESLVSGEDGKSWFDSLEGLMSVGALKELEKQAPPHRNTISNWVSRGGGGR